MSTISKFKMPPVYAAHDTNVTTSLLIPANVCPFTPMMIEIPDNVAPHFLITNIALNDISQQIYAGAIPASLFAASAHRREIAMKTIDSQAELRISATNISSEARSFHASIEGIPHRTEPIDQSSLQIVGFGQTTVPGNRVCRISVEPQINITPEWLHVPPHVLESFQIDDVISCCRLVPSYVPKHFLSKRALECCGAICFVPHPVVSIDHLITISVTNLDASPQNFQAAILGSLARTP